MCKKEDNGWWQLDSKLGQYMNLDGNYLKS